MKKKLPSLLVASTTLLYFFSTTASSASAFSPPNTSNSYSNSHHTISRPALLLTTHHHHHHAPLPPWHLRATTTSSSTSSDSNDEIEMRTLGNSIILSAAKSHGATDKMISIEWKADRIIVTVDVSQDEEYEGGGGSVVVGELEDAEDYQDDFETDYDDEYDDEYDDDLEEYSYDPELDEQDFNEQEEEDEDFEALQAQLGLHEQDNNSSSSSSQQIDLTLIARTINEYLSADGENTPQFKIAQLHEIEVTTPEFDNVLRVYGGEGGGVNMFEVYKGFDVIVDYWEVPKKKKKKKSGKAGKETVSTMEDGSTNQNQEANEGEEADEPEPEPTRTQKLIEGKLVGRDEDKDVTMINVKGRIVKIKNDMIESVKLPKAKREKGVK